MDDGAADLRWKAGDSGSNAERLGKPGGSRSGRGKTEADACISRTNPVIMGTRTEESEKEGKVPGPGAEKADGKDS